MSLEPTAENTGIKPQRISTKHFNRLKVLGAVLTLGGIALFSYFVYSVGVTEILKNIEKFGFSGFGIMLLIASPIITAGMVSRRPSSYGS